MDHTCRCILIIHKFGVIMNFVFYALEQQQEQKQQQQQQ